MSSFDEFEIGDTSEYTTQKLDSKPAYQSNGGGGGFQKGKFKPREPEGPAEVYLPYTVSLNPDFPTNLRHDLETIIKRFNEQNYTLRLGGNSGHESDLESLSTRLELHLPWRGFNDKQSKLTWNNSHCFDIAKMYTPNYDKLKDPVKAMLARNVRLMLGKDLKGPTLCLVTYTADGASSAGERTPKTGYAGQLIAMASTMKIPVFNLAKPNTLERIQKYLSI